MAFQAKSVKGLNPKLENQSKDASPDASGSSGSNNNNAPKYGTVIPNRIFVGGISSATTETDLAQLFSNYGRVTGTKIIADRAGVSKGYGFVTFETEEEAKRLQKDADSIILRDRRLNIAPAIKKQGFVRSFDQGGPGTGAGCAPPNSGGTAQVYHQNGISYAYHNGMAFFSPTSASAPVTPIPSTQVDPGLFTGAYTNAAPHVTTYAPSMLYPAPMFFQNPQYQFQVPYDGCYGMGEGQGTTMIMQNGSGDNGGGGGGNGGQYLVTGGGGGTAPSSGAPTPQPTHLPPTASPQHPPQPHYQDMAPAPTYTLHHPVAPYTCLAIPQDNPPAPPLIHYTVARRPYEPTGIIEWQNNDGRNNQLQGRCYRSEVDIKGGNDSANGGASTKPDSTAEVGEMKVKAEATVATTTPVVSLLSIESEEELQGSRQQRRQRHKGGYQPPAPAPPKHLNNNNPEATDRNLANKAGTIDKQDVRPLHPPHQPPARLHPPPVPYPSDCPTFNFRPSSLQVPQYPYCTPARNYYGPGIVHIPQRRLGNNHRRHSAGGRGGRYRGGGSSHNSSRSSSSQGRGQCGGGGGGGSGGGGGGSVSTEGGDCGALTPPTTPRCSPTTPTSAPSASSITHTIQALSI